MKEKSLKNLKRKVINSSIAMFMIGLRKMFASISLLRYTLKKMRLMLNVWVETGEGNYDYTLNNYIGYSVTYEPIQEESSLLWLARQQGYSKEELLDAVMNGNTKGSKFLESVVDEQDNLTSHMNRLEFFIRMSILDVIKIKEEGIKEDLLSLKKQIVD